MSRAMNLPLRVSGGASRRARLGALARQPARQRWAARSGTVARVRTSSRLGLLLLLASALFFTYVLWA